MTQRSKVDIQGEDITSGTASDSQPHVSTSAASQPPENSTWRLVGTLLLLAITLVLPMTIVAAEVSRYTVLSPVDELQHIDYLLRSPTLIVLGDRVQEPAMREEVCRGIDAGIELPACDSPTLVPEQFQEDGFNTAYIHPPTYYFLTSVLAAPGRFLGLEPVTSGRLVGGAWLALGLLLTWIVGRRLKVDAVALCSALLLIGVMPQVIYSSSVINPDAVSLPVGAAALLFTIEAERRSGWWRWTLLAAAAIVAVAFKTQNLIVIACLTLYLLLRAWSAFWDTRKNSGLPTQRTAHPSVVIGMSVALGAGALVGVAAWLKATSLLARGSTADIPMSSGFAPTDFPTPQIIASIGSFFPPSSGYVSKFLQGSEVQIGMIVTGLILVICCAGAGWFREGGSPEITYLARAVTVTAILGAPLMVVANYAILGSVFVLPARYGLSLLPIIAVCAASAVRSSAGRALFGFVALAIATATLVNIATTAAS